MVRCICSKELRLSCTTSTTISVTTHSSAPSTLHQDPSIDVRKFNEQASVPGAMNEYGKMVYIDSVYQHTNSLLDASRAQIRNEDSTYVALIPRDAAWKEALEKVSKIYNYGTRYRYDWDGANFTKEYRLDASTFANKSMTLADSLRERNVRLNIVSICSSLLIASRGMRTWILQHSSTTSSMLTPSFLRLELRSITRLLPVQRSKIPISTPRWQGLLPIALPTVMYSNSKTITSIPLTFG